MPTSGDIARFRQRIVELSRDLGRDGLEEILRSFLAESRSRIASLPGFLDSRDLRELARCAHSIKGSSAIFGLADLEQAALAVELSTRVPDAPEIEDRVARLRSHYENLAPSLRLDGTEPPLAPGP